MTGHLADLPDRVVLALTIWGEARGEGVEGQLAVGNVVRNRLKRAINTTPRWRDICLAPKQFSCFNADDPNRVQILHAAEMLMTNAPTPELREALWIADGVVSGAAMDNTYGSLNYLTARLLESDHPPAWAVGKPILARIGRHVFVTA